MCVLRGNVDNLQNWGEEIKYLKIDYLYFKLWYAIVI